MFSPVLTTLLALAQYVSAQTGVELDEPMLRGGRPNGPQAMLRFGCSQLVIERLDPYISLLLLTIDNDLTELDSSILDLTHQLTCIRLSAEYVQPILSTSI